MAEQISPCALTTLPRVKDLLFDPNLTILVTGCSITEDSPTITAGTIPQGRNVIAGQQISGLGIPSGTTVASISGSTITLSQNATASNTGQTVTVIDQTPMYDTILTRMINSVSQWMATECGRFSFVYQQYLNDTYSISNPRQECLYLRNTPVWPASDGTHLPDFSWRTGTPSNPTWTEFLPDQYELVDPHPIPTGPSAGAIWYPSGVVRVYGYLPRVTNNMIRATYYGGYPVNWANAGDQQTHLLPDDLTATAENLVVRRFKRRMLAGQSSMTVEGVTVGGWRNVLDVEDEAVFGQYRQLNF